MDLPLGPLAGAGREAVGAGGFRGYDSLDEMVGVNGDPALIQGESAMKKQVKKITLSKETLLKLDDSQGFIVFGGSGSNCGNITCVRDCGRSGLETC